MTTSFSLAQLGWKPFFQQQLSLDDWQQAVAGRIVAHHRSHVEVITVEPSLRLTLPLLTSMPAMTVGDWLLLDTEGQFQQLLSRQSLFSRRAAGSQLNLQLIAANVDTVFIVSSLNQNFSLNRIERYLVLAKEADVEPVVVLTKADLCEESEAYVKQVQALDSLLMVEAINALEPRSVASLLPWCQTGSTVAVMGSSGVGKSTLINTLAGTDQQATGAIREADSKGRHTTSSRSLQVLSSGGLLLDTPGMRELQLANCADGVEQTFADISELAESCQFIDCQHQSEPGCAVQTAIETGELDARRLQNYLKLQREQMLNSASLAEKRAKDRKLSRYYRSVLTEAQQRKKGR